MQKTDPNNDEFAKLDALLADLLSEVEQPILLNPQGTLKNWDHSSSSSSYNKLQQNKNNVNSSNKCEMLKTLDDIERSVDYLNEQKEKLKFKKENALYYQKERGTDKDVILEDEELTQQDNQPFRKIKSKFDYYVSNSNEQNNGDIPSFSSNKQQQHGVSTNSFNTSKLSNHEQFSNNSMFINENKPPISPNAYTKFNQKHDNSMHGFQTIPSTNYNSNQNVSIQSFTLTIFNLKVSCFLK